MWDRSGIALARRSVTCVRRVEAASVTCQVSQVRNCTLYEARQHEQALDVKLYGGNDNRQTRCLR